MKAFSQLRKILAEATKTVVVGWDQGMPDRSLAGDFKDEFGIYIDDYNKRKSTLTVSGSEKDLVTWLSAKNGGMGYDKKDAQNMVKKAKVSR